MSKLAVIGGLFLVLGGLGVAFLAANRPQRIVIDANPPDGFPEQGFSHESFEKLLEAYVDSEGRTNYEGWHASSDDRLKLDAYLAAVSRYSPENSPERFLHRSDALAYWLYAYNGYVIRSVLDHWPLDSVTDVKAPVEIVKGLGFFYRQRFSFGGEFMNLFDVENRKIRKAFKDPRIHFVLNCASESCPVRRPELPTGLELEQLLEDSTRGFINDDANVRIDHQAKTVQLSSIFKWYKSDFVNSVRAAGKSTDNALLAYISGYADSALAVDIDRARSYELRFADYDWSLNSSR